MSRINIRNGEFWRVERLVKTYKSIPKNTKINWCQCMTMRETFLSM
jgi:hypothetical protein